MFPDKWQVRVVIDGIERIVNEKDDAAMKERLLHFKELGIDLSLVTVVPLRDVKTGAEWLNVYFGIKEEK